MKSGMPDAGDRAAWAAIYDRVAEAKKKMPVTEAHGALVRLIRVLDSDCCESLRSRFFRNLDIGGEPGREIFRRAALGQSAGEMAAALHLTKEALDREMYRVTSRFWLACRLTDRKLGTNRTETLWKMLYPREGESCPVGTDQTAR